MPKFNTEWIFVENLKPQNRNCWQFLKYRNTGRCLGNKFFRLHKTIKLCKSGPGGRIAWNKWPLLWSHGLLATARQMITQSELGGWETREVFPGIAPEPSSSTQIKNRLLCCHNHKQTGPSHRPCCQCPVENYRVLSWWSCQLPF